MALTEAAYKAMQQALVKEEEVTVAKHLNKSYRVQVRSFAGHHNLTMYQAFEFLGLAKWFGENPFKNPGNVPSANIDYPWPSLPQVCPKGCKVCSTPTEKGGMAGTLLTNAPALYAPNGQSGKIVLNVSEQPDDDLPAKSPSDLSFGKDGPDPVLLNLKPGEQIVLRAKSKTMIALVEEQIDYVRF